MRNLARTSEDPLPTHPADPTSRGRRSLHNPVSEPPIGKTYAVCRRAGG
jgi:hypothetical protein